MNGGNIEHPTGGGFEGLAFGYGLGYGGIVVLSFAFVSFSLSCPFGF